jgi:hypothetical protein
MDLRSRLANAPPTLIGLGDTEPFALRLAQAVAYCAPRAYAADPLASLRSDQFRPRVLESHRAASVYAIVNLRTVYVPRDLSPVTGSEGLAGGRLLAYFPDAELSDGAAEQETGGFFDVNNAPPWDTWVALFRDDRTTDRSYQEFLVSWVPPGFVALAERGLSVNPESCIVWLADVEAPLCDELRAHGLLR